MCYFEIGGYALWALHIKTIIFWWNSLILIVIFLHSLMSLAFAGSIGMTLVILACALPDLK